MMNCSHVSNGNRPFYSEEALGWYDILALKFLKHKFLCHENVPVLHVLINEQHDSLMTRCILTNYNMRLMSKAGLCCRWINITYFCSRLKSTLCQH